jgi:predicted dehydrogenase
MAPVRWGILGSGLICSDFVQALRSCEGAHVTAVGARSPEKARAFAEANAIPSSYGSYEELVADPVVDIVYVGTVRRPLHVPPPPAPRPRMMTLLYTSSHASATGAYDA